MERLFLILAVILIGVAAFFVWTSNNDGIFVAAVAGAVCFFLSIRLEVGARVKARKAEEEEKLAADERR